MAKTYKSYQFIDKDPIIDVLKTAIDDSSKQWKEISEESGVKETTLFAWFYGITKRPQHSTLEAVFRVLGMRLVPIAYSVKAENSVVSFPKKKRVLK